MPLENQGTECPWEERRHTASGGLGPFSAEGGKARDTGETKGAVGSSRDSVLAAGMGGSLSNSDV